MNLTARRMFLGVLIGTIGLACGPLAPFPVTLPTLSSPMNRVILLTASAPEITSAAGSEKSLEPLAEKLKREFQSQFRAAGFIVETDPKQTYHLEARFLLSVEERVKHIHPDTQQSSDDWKGSFVVSFYLEGKVLAQGTMKLYTYFGETRWGDSLPESGYLPPTLLSGVNDTIRQLIGSEGLSQFAQSLIPKPKYAEIILLIQGDPEIKGEKSDAAAKFAAILKDDFQTRFIKLGFPVNTDPNQPYHLEVKFSLVVAHALSHNCGPSMDGKWVTSMVYLGKVIAQTVTDIQSSNCAPYFDAMDSIVELLKSPAVEEIARNPPKPVNSAEAQATVEKPIVAVFDIQDSSGRFAKETIDPLTEYLIAKLTELSVYRIVPRDQLRQRLSQEKREGFKECYEQSCQIELGKALSASKSLSTRLIRVGSKCAITSTLYDLQTETSEKAVSVRTDCHDDALMAGIDNIALQLAGKSIPPPSAPEETPTPVESPQ